ncbi:MAG TPA: GIY-YIG nuclease family protein [Oceanithermus profundus]|uniref:GIY-YIG nuclease family protein n=1 Tax=Oceanithermus profundus TaxID=187137 RepID=A0A7C5WWK5_9DEIN|nr:GIY-YIG nuclease family protein [Oceanithermus profundus]
MEPAVYILASKKDGVLYIGVTSELKRRVWEHREGIGSVFTRKYHVHKLVYFERHPSMESAIVREKRLKKWDRAWKVRLIEATNPDWKDLYDML